MSHACIPDFAAPAPVRRPTTATTTRLPPPSARYDAPPANEPLPGEIEPWQAVAPVRPDTAFVRALRVMDAAGELVAAVLIVAGGAVLVGFALLL